MKDTASKTTRRQEATTPQLALAAMIDARATLHDAIVSAGMTVLGAMLEEERAKLCGPRYEHHQDASRGGPATKTASSRSVGGQRVRVRRPRVHSVDGREVKLETWKQFAEVDPLTPARRRADGPRRLDAEVRSLDRARAAGTRSARHEQEC